MANLKEVQDYCLSEYKKIRHELRIFHGGIHEWFAKHPSLVEITPPLIHSIKGRLKDPQHLSSKIERKLLNTGPDWDEAAVFRSLTDLAGVRVLLLHQKQFAGVHEAITAKVSGGDWVLEENPKAYSWDPDSVTFFKSLGIESQLKDSHYTSVHYVVRPKPGSPLVCEIQVRTLFEEIWGEVDHTLNYPEPTSNVACREQLRVLAKVVGAGSRLVDSIFLSAEDTYAVHAPKSDKADVQIAFENLGNQVPEPPAVLPPAEPLAEGPPEMPEVS